MKNFSITSVVAVVVSTLFFLLPLPTTAVAISITDYYYGHGTYINRSLIHSHSANWTFDLTDNGFDPLTQYITQGKIFASFSDDYDSSPSPEKAKLSLGTSYFNCSDRFYWEWTSGHTGGWRFPLSLRTLEVLNSTGKINAYLKSESGDFYFWLAKLEVYIENRPTAPVPEPTTLFLVAAGLLALTGVRVKLNLRI